MTLPEVRVGTESQSVFVSVAAAVASVTTPLAQVATIVFVNVAVLPLATTTAVPFARANVVWTAVALEARSTSSWPG